MPVDLPAAIRDYFSGKNARDFAFAGAGFARDAIVEDEGRNHQGPADIRAWLEDTVHKYDDRAAVKGVVSNDDAVEVVAEVTGAFPGSPILLRFNFTMKDERIVHLRIAP